MKRIVSIIVCILALAMNASAQTNFLESLRSSVEGKGRIAVMQSPAIDSLINNNRPKDSTAVTTTVKSSKSTSQSTASAATQSDAAKKTTPAKASERKMIYRIQVYSGGNTQKDRLAAERAGKIMKAHFPASPVFVHFYSPSWKCRMGDFTDEQEARRVLAQVKSLGFPQACILGNRAGRRGR